MSDVIPINRAAEMAALQEDVTLLRKRLNGLYDHIGRLNVQLDALVDAQQKQVEAIADTFDAHRNSDEQIMSIIILQQKQLDKLIEE